MSKMIYLDHAAATPLSAKARQAMESYFADDFFNPSAAYLPAKKVRADYEVAKDQIAHAIGAKGPDIVITSGATEANNLAFTIKNLYPNAKTLALETEHASVLSLADITLKVTLVGEIDLSDLRKKLTDDVVLVSIALANNELGTIQPLADVAEIIRAERRRRLEQGIDLPIYLHSDASQALNLVDINVARLGVDLLTLNAAKVYGPKGVGALYIAHGVKLSPITKGGGQELGLRSGTENVPGVIGFAAALADAKEHLNGNRKKYQKFTQIFLEKLNSFAVKPKILNNSKHCLVNFVSLCYPGLDAERLIYRLEEQGVLISTGAACAASKGQPSHVLRAIGLSDEEIAGSLRITFGATNTEEDVLAAANLISEAALAETRRQDG